MGDFLSETVVETRSEKNPPKNGQICADLTIFRVFFFRYGSPRSALENGSEYPMVPTDLPLRNCAVDLKMYRVSEIRTEMDRVSEIRPKLV